MYVLVCESMHVCAFVQPLLPSPAISRAHRRTLLHYHSDTGLPLLDLLQCPGSVNMARVCDSASHMFLPLLVGGLCADAGERLTTAAGLLERLERSCRLQFQWEQCSSTASLYSAVSPREALALETALVENRSVVHLSSSCIVDISAAAAACAGLAQELVLPAASDTLLLRRVLRDTVRTDASPIPAWQRLCNAQEWLQCPPWQNALLETRSPTADAHLFRKLTIRPGSLCSVQIQHAFKTDPCVSPCVCRYIYALTLRQILRTCCSM